MSSNVVSDKVKNRAVPALAVHDAERALAFYAKAFGAKEVSERIPWEGKIGHGDRNQRCTCDACRRIPDVQQES